MKTIMIDLDDTIVIGGYLDLVNSYQNTNFQITDLEGYYFEDLLKDGITDDYIKYFYNHNVYHYTKVFDNAK